MMSLFTDVEIEAMNNCELDQGQLLDNEWHRGG